MLVPVLPLHCQCAATQCTHSVAAPRRASARRVTATGSLSGAAGQAAGVRQGSSAARTVDPSAPHAGGAAQAQAGSVPLPPRHREPRTDRSYLMSAQRELEEARRVRPAVTQRHESMLLRSGRPPG